MFADGGSALVERRRHENRTRQEFALGGDIGCPDLAGEEKRVLCLDPLESQLW